MVKSNSGNNLIRANIGAASLHGILLVALIVFYFLNNPEKTSVSLFDESNKALPSLKKATKSFAI